MLLAINCNNTNTVFSVWEGEVMRGSWRAATNPERTADEYYVWLERLLGLKDIAIPAITGTIIASVVPEAMFNLTTFCTRYCGRDPMIVGDPGVDLGVRALVDRPDEVGSDRLVNTVAAHDRYEGAQIVVDFGTATTFDVVDKDGNYCGGVIAPGPNLSLRALHLAAAKLPSVPIRRTEQVIGKSTISCMQSGIFWGYVGMIEGLVSRVRAEFGQPMGVVATGGLAPLFIGATDAIEKIDSDLLLWGLRLIWERNRKA